MRPHQRLVHHDPKLNEPSRWYRLVDENEHYFFAVIWGKEGFLTSVVHAVPKSDYYVTLVKEKAVQSDDVGDIL